MQHMASSNYDIPTVFLRALETLLQAESRRLITYEATQLHIEPAALLEAVQPHLKYAIPTSLWDNFEITLKANVKQFIKRCATVLEIDPNALMRLVMPPKEMSKVYFQACPEDAFDCSCRAFIGLADGTLAARCFQPTVPSTNYCGLHQHARPAIQRRIDVAEFDRLKSAADRPELWVDPATGSVYDSELRPTGFYDRGTGKLTLMRLIK
jgi:hypothetical protein